MKRSQTATYLKNFLQIAPIALALWRSVEAKHIATVSLPSPMLDIGCGFGEFARGFFEKPVDIGLDISAQNIYSAAKTHKYKNLVVGDARDMPFTDRTFSTVFSLSTFEHITRPEKVISEAYRVLKPGGKLVTTIETNAVDKTSIYQSFFKKYKLLFLAQLYANIYNTVFKRTTLLPKKRWEKMILDAGFEIEVSQDIISPKITALFETFLITAWPSQLLMPIFGRRVCWRPDFLNTMLTKLFLPYVAAEDKNGTNYFVVARKPKK